MDPETDGETDGETVLEVIKPDKPWLFKPGHCGNPNGRPKKTEEERELAEILRSRGAWALKRLIEIADPNSLYTTQSDRIKALTTILSYALGKPREFLEIKSDIQPVIAWEPLNDHEWVLKYGELAGNTGAKSLGTTEGTTTSSD